MGGGVTDITDGMEVVDGMEVADGRGVTDGTDGRKVVLGS